MMKRSIHYTNERKWFVILYLGLLLGLIFVWFLIWVFRNSNFSINSFLNTNLNQISLVVTAWGVLGILTQLIEKKKKDPFLHLYNQHKDRIRILENFSQNSYFSSHITVYDELIRMLDRCSSFKDSDNVKLYMLTCTPSVDYPERLNKDFSKWGSDFRRKIANILKNEKAAIELYHLPDTVISGFNPLQNFIEALAGYCAEITKNNPNHVEINKLIYDREKQYISDLETTDKTDVSGDNKKKGTIIINSTHHAEIPFQIFIYETNNYGEVLVSFANKAILQDKETKDYKGFHSIDSTVVDAFKKIFNAYTSSHRRIPIKPIHTLNIINSIKQKGKHTIENYLNENIDIEVVNGMFSPAYANSSKFTSYALIRILKKNDKVIDIGSGTGVQALIAYNYLKNKLETESPLVYAIEPCKISIGVLESNANRNVADIKIKNWVLHTDNGSQEYLYPNHGFGKLICLDTKNEANLEGNKFDVIIGDLPYVDTEADTDFERAFFDIAHKAHDALFKMFANESFVNDNARLVTSFSSLGGIDDIIKFERIICDNNLVILQRFSFNENDYLWYVYVIVKKEYYKSFNDRYWWEKLNCIPKSE